MLLKRGMGNGEWGMGNGEWGIVVSGNTKKISWSLRSTAKRRGLHVVSERRKVRIRGGWQRGLEPSLHDRPSKEIWPSRTVY